MKRNQIIKFEDKIISWNGGVGSTFRLIEKIDGELKEVKCEVVKCEIIEENKGYWRRASGLAKVISVKGIIKKYW